jgi:glycosyltransferase involved in cell wall biosynthesis
LLRPLQDRAAAEPRLRVPGFLSEAAKADWLAAADVVALPSGVFETQPIVLMEALRSGTPVHGTYDEWLPAGLRRFGRFGDDVRLALEAVRIDAEPAAALVPTWDDAARATIAVYRSVAAGPAGGVSGVANPPEQGSTPPVGTTRRGSRGGAR